MSAGFEHTCGVKTDGTLACWGDNSQGRASPPTGTFTQVTAGLPTYLRDPVGRHGGVLGGRHVGQATPPGGTFTQVSAGDFHTCGVRTDGTLACWGNQPAPPAGTYIQVSVQDQFLRDADSRPAVLLGRLGTPPPSGSRILKFRGTAERVGSGVANGKVSVSGKMEGVQLPDLRLATLTLQRFLFEGAGSAELVHRSAERELMPLNLSPRRGSSATAAIYETASGVVPKLRVELKQRDPSKGEVEFNARVERVMIESAVACTDSEEGNTDLRMRMTLTSGAGTSVVIDTEQRWACRDDTLKTP